MENVRWVNISIEFAGIVLSLLGILQTFVGAKSDKPTKKHLVSFFIMLILYLLLDLAGQTVRLSEGLVCRKCFLVLKLVGFCTLCSLTYIISDYFLQILALEERQKHFRRIYVLLIVFQGIFVLSSLFTGVVFTVDSESNLRLNVWYPLAYLLIGVVLLIDFALLIRERNRLTRQEKIAFSAYFILPSIGIPLQCLFQDVSVMIFVTILAATIMYFFILADQTERYYREREENERLKLDILLAQIQPHFLFNSLLIIQQLCLNDPEKASEAIGDFSGYLRHNTDFALTDEPIPFEAELEHVCQYVRLQKLRFGEDLDVRFEIGTKEFSVPALTLQPLVENAIRYGVRKKQSGEGTVVIRSKEYEDRFEVEVEDDGPGFVPEKIPETSGRSGVGLKNVRDRVRMSNGGDLKIVSAPGQGTKVTLTFPKGGDT